MKKLALVSLGCSKNLVDSEKMLGSLTTEYDFTENLEEANIIIVNTCSFIDKAKKESTEAILNAVEYKDGNCDVLIVTGCMAEEFKNDILEELPEVNAVVGTTAYSDITRIVNEAYKGKREVYIGNENSNIEEKATRILSTPNHYAYIKIAEGCDNCCTYCIIPKLRGKYKSRKLENIYDEVEELTKKGIKEAILIAQDTTKYGIDIYGKKSLVDLIRELSKIKELEHIRVLYCYPEDIDDELINELATNKKLYKYLDIPIQHLSDGILKKMGRKITYKRIEEIVKKLREKVENITIRTTIIVGFPTETDKDFELLYNRLKKLKFDHLGVFEYSREKGTPAARFKEQVSKSVKKKRYEDIMLLQKDITERKNKKKLKKTFDVVIEGIADDGLFYYGRSEAEAPDVDNLIYFTSKEELTIGEYVKVKILNIDDYDLIGEVL